jgi:DNA adenine methylase
VTAKPFIKWAGGKTRVLPELRARLPQEWNRYFEPFVGGGSFFFSLEGACAYGAVLNDLNEALIATYRAVAKDADAVVVQLEMHKAAHAVDTYYYTVRDAWNRGYYANEPARLAAAFIYLNKTGFNGLWRVNRAGEHNVPRGDYVNPSVYDVGELREASRALQRVDLRAGEYRAATVEAEDGDFAYFDPPYDPVSETSNFTAYTKDAFGKEQQQQLADHARELRDRGVHVMLSNNDTPYIRALYEGFHVDTVQVGRAINSKGAKRGKVPEVIITSYEVKRT